jgi:ATP-binding cassette subfamily A (ABC1) protein 3
LDVVASQTRIATQFIPFDYALPAATGNLIQFAFYFGLVMAANSAFFSLYVCQERTGSVRAMQYSNSVRPLPLWTAYTLFDWLNTLVAAVVIIVILAAAHGTAWFGVGYFFVVLALYGLAAVLVAYIIAGFAKSSFSAFALVAAGQW